MLKEYLIGLSFKRSMANFYGACALLILGQVSVLQAEPFVPAFDRFGLHQEIPEHHSASLLLTELNCTACHQTSQKILAFKGAPDLKGAGTRLSKNWIKAYILNPAGMKPGTTMPSVLHGYGSDEKQTIATAIAEFLATQEQNFPELKATGLIPVKHEFWLKGDVENGGKLYHSVGCVACHAADDEYASENRQPSSLDKLLEQLDPEELAELGLSGKARVVNSIPHGDLNSKYSLLSLSHFLHDPLRTRPAGRMPNLKLQPTEAADIAAYLLRDQKPEQIEMTLTQPEPVDADLAAEGKKFFVEVGCANCHQLPGIEMKTIATQLEALNSNAERSCLGKPDAKQPFYSLSQEQEEALRSFGDTREHESLVKQSHQLTMLQLNCFACHERNDLGGIGRKRQQYFETVGHVDIGDEGRFPPQLTHVGKKLNPSWFKKVLDGKGDIRPHMTIRMPIFPAEELKELPKQLAIADEDDTASEKDVFGDLTNLAKPGRELLNTGCIQCHPLRGENLASVVGTDLSGVHQRVRPAWFKEFLRNPIALKKRTRMPTFFPNGVSSNPELLDGNVDQQIAAIWAYLKENEKHPLPEKILEARSKNFELVPTDKPIVLRTFMKDAGLHAIAVGFPEKIHFAFDSENCQLVEAWKGKFLDAHGTWYNRFTPLEEPLGGERIKIPSRFSVSISKFSELTDNDISDLQKLSHKQFQGFQIDQNGIPTFHYQMAGRLVEDRISPGNIGELRRVIKIRSLVEGTEVESPSIQFHLLSGKSIHKVNSREFVNDSGLTVTVPSSSPLQPVVFKHPDFPNIQHCISPANSRKPIEFEIVYKW